MSRRDLNGAENILTNLKTFLDKHNAPIKNFERDRYNIMKARSLNLIGKHLEALNTIEKCSSMNHQKASNFLKVKFSILMKLQRFKEAREILPSDENSKKKKQQRLVQLVDSFGVLQVYH